MNKILPVLFILIFLSSCINLREPYPKIEYYTLNQEQSMLKGLPKKNNIVMVRRVLVNESFNTSHILINTESSKVQRLFYHRWVSDVSTMTTDFFVTRLNQSSLFQKGVITSGSIAVPDYIIEPQLIEMTAHNSEPETNGENYVEIVLKVDVMKRMADNKLIVVYSNIYKQKYVRKNSEIQYIPVAYSNVFSIAVDNIISDLSNIFE